MYVLNIGALVCLKGQQMRWKCFFPVRLFSFPFFGWCTLFFYDGKHEILVRTQLRIWTLTFPPYFLFKKQIIILEKCSRRKIMEDHEWISKDGIFIAHQEKRQMWPDQHHLKKQKIRKEKQNFFRKYTSWNEYRPWHVSDWRRIWLSCYFLRRAVGGLLYGQSEESNGTFHPTAVKIVTTALNT